MEYTWDMDRLCKYETQIKRFMASNKLLKKEIKIDTSQVSNNPIIVNSFVKIDEEYLYLKATNYSTMESITIKCDRENFICNKNN